MDIFETLFDVNAARLLNFWFTMQLQTAGFILLIWLIERALPARLATPRFRYLLWTTALVKALIPPVISLPGSSGLPAPSVILAPVEAIAGTTFAADTAGISFPAILLSLIAASSLFLAAVAAWRAIGLRRLLREAVPFDRAPAGDWPAIMVIDGIPSPLAAGLRRPRIYITPAIAEAPREILLAVLQHERAHIRRRDGLMVLLQTLVQIAYVLNPLMWLANLRLFRYRELICDDEAMQTSGTLPREYGRLLLGFAEAQPSRVLQTGTCFFETRRGFVQRVNELFNSGSRTVMQWKHYAAVVALSLLILPLSWHCERKVTYTETLTEYPEDSLAAAQPLASPQASVDYPVKSTMEYSKKDDLKSVAGPSIVGGMDALSSHIKYPERAMKEGLEGVVIVEATVEEDGPASSVRVIRSVHPLLDAAALEAVRSVKFKAGFRNESDIPSTITIPIKFRLK